MKNYQITKKVFYLTVLLLIADALYFTIDGIGSFVVLGYGVLFYFPFIFLLALFDFFYLKNRNLYFSGLIILICLGMLTLYILSQGYFDSVFSLV